MMLVDLLLHRSSETFSLFEIFLLLALYYGSTQGCGPVIVQEGEMANLIFGFNQDISALRYNFLILHYGFDNKYKDTVLDCFWTKEKVPDCHILQRFSVVNVTSQLHIKIDEALKIDAGVYECSIVVSDGNKMVVCKLTLNVQDAIISTDSPSEDLTSNSSQYISVTASEDKSRNVGQEQSYEHRIPIILGVTVLVAILACLLYFIKRHLEEFQQCKFFHTENKKETDESLETETMDTMEKVDNTDINLQERDSCLRIIIETKPLSEEQHHFMCENNRAETSASAATQMIVDERMDLGENVHIRNKTCA